MVVPRPTGAQVIWESVDSRDQIRDAREWLYDWWTFFGFFLKIGYAMSFLVARYAKDEDTPESVIDVSSVDADALAELLEVPAGRFTDVYPLKPQHADVFRRLTGIQLDLDRFDYFLEVVAA